METPREHPGKGACERIKRADGSASREDYTSALIYIIDVLDDLCRKVADRNRAFAPPTPEEVTAYAKSISFVLDGQYFCDYYTARNWCVGKVKMKSWQACVRTWKTRRNEQPANTARPSRIPDNLRSDHGL